VVASLTSAERTPDRPAVSLRAVGKPRGSRRRGDSVVTPTENAFIPIAQQAPAEQPLITNVRIQDVCPGETVGHIGEAYDGNIAQVILHALDPSHPQPVVCGPSGPSY
jgi:hypothetical protein